MCVIAVKPAGIAMPDSTTIENMWYRNPDGAGIMYTRNGWVHIEKGFMSLDDLEDALDRISKDVDLTTVPVVMHFRITTHGGTVPGNTHPFPVSEDIHTLKKLRINTRLGVAHNGIIDITTRNKDISDTMEYIASQLAPLYLGVPNFYENKHLMKLVENAIGSKMAILTNNGELYTIGNFIEHNGIKYSNTSYEGWTYSNYSKWSCYDGRWDGWPDDFETELKLVRYVGEEDGEFLTNAKGTMSMGDGIYAVDKDGIVYYYSEYFGVLRRCAGYVRAWTEDGRPLLARDDDDLSECEPVYVEPGNTSKAYNDYDIFNEPYEALSLAEYESGWKQ